MDNILNKLRDIELRYQELEGLLSDAQVASRQGLYQKYAKEHSDLSDLVDTIRRYEKNMKRIADNKELLAENDEDLRAMVKEEMSQLEQEQAELEDKIKILLLPKDPNDDKNVFLEIRAGTGGDEAGLFVGDLFRMYARYAESQGWRVEIVSSSPAGGMGGFKEIIAQIEGRGAYSRLKYESGVHRVQRVPVTGRDGRIHQAHVRFYYIAGPRRHEHGQVYAVSGRAVVVHHPRRGDLRGRLASDELSQFCFYPERD